MLSGLQSPRLDWVGPGKAGQCGIDWFRCSAGPLTGPKSQYRIHRDKLKAKTSLQERINCQVIMEN